MKKNEDTATKSYHHGDLKKALLKAAELILEEDGIQALSLREAARRVGVSHTAPRNHFGDMTGLLSELAAEGYLRFADALRKGADAAGDDPRSRLRAMGRAYLGFAITHPGLFTLMFRSEQLDTSRPALHDALAASRSAVEQAVSARTREADDVSPLAQAARLVAVRSLVHGFVVLLLENRLRGVMASVPGADAETLLDAVMESLSFAGID
jgi:AcrR family transcriptional regulator